MTQLRPSATRRSTSAIAAGEVGELALDRAVRGEEQEHDPDDGLAGGPADRHGVGGPLEAVALHPAVELVGIGAGGRLVVDDDQAVVAR